MQKIFLLISTFFLLLFFTSCTSEEQSIRDENHVKETIQNATNVKSLSKSKFDIIKNSAGDFAIYLQKAEDDNTRSFHLVSLEQDSIIFSDKLLNGEVRWISEYDFSLIEHPGMIKDEDDQIKPKYIYNAITQKKK